MLNPRKSSSHSIDFKSLNIQRMMIMMVIHRTFISSQKREKKKTISVAEEDDR